MLEGINDAWNSLWRIFSINTFNGEQNVFNNLSKILKEVRTGFFYIGGEIARQVFEGGSEVFKTLRDEFTRLFTTDPSSSDAKGATNNLKGSSSQAGFGSTKGFAGSKGGGGSKSSVSQSNQTSDLQERMKRQRYLQQMQDNQKQNSGRTFER